jgi:bleomycin hydrolase
VGGLGRSDIVRPALAWLAIARFFSGAGKTSPPTRSTAQHVALTGECRGAMRRAKKAPEKTQKKEYFNVFRLEGCQRTVKLPAFNLFLNTMRYTFLLVSVTLICFSGTVSSQTLKAKKDGHIEFSVIKDLEKTPVDNQYKTSTCWSFSALSFFESELLRMGKGEHNLSEMFVVNQTYRAKADRYVRTHGSINFAPGGGFQDALYVMKNFGMLPQEAYPAKLPNEKNHMHNEMDAVLKGIVEAVLKNPNGRLSPAWKNAFGGAIDAYLGAMPEKFSFKGQEYTPASYMKSLGINPEDYVILASVSHHPDYSGFILEIPDNWASQPSYNVPLEDLQKIMSQAVMNGYTFAWAADISEKGFSWKNGVAIVPEKDWEDISSTEKDSLLSYPVAQLKITPEMRQQAFDNYETQDDHGMHITGMVKDQNGTIYYKVKNSWGTKGNDCDGYLYASEAYVLYKTTNIMLHKKAIPTEIAKKLGIK